MFNKTWNIHKTTPFYNFSPIQYNTYEAELLAFIVANARNMSSSTLAQQTQSGASTFIAASRHFPGQIDGSGRSLMETLDDLGDITGIRFQSLDLYDARVEDDGESVSQFSLMISITVKPKGKTREQLYFCAVILDQLDGRIDRPDSVFTHFNLVLLKAPVLIGQLLIQWLERKFDCKICRLLLQSYDLRRIVNTSIEVMYNHAQGQDERKARPIELHYAFPEGVSGLKSISVSLPTDEARQLLVSREEGSSSGFLDGVETHCSDSMRIDFGRLNLTRAGCSSWYLASEGKIKLPGTMGRLHRIELENFKSYKGHQTIGPFNDFTCVIGPNGAGKSNLMDAISFVLGVKSAQLRSTQLRELIYRDRADDSEEAQRNGVSGSSRQGTGNDADPRKTSVMAVYLKDDGSEVRFTRSVNMAGVSEYKINGKVMLYSDYDKALQEINILVKARNFLVFQGDVEAIASQSPKDLTKLIEQISGSLELKQEYDRLQQEQERAVENSTFNFHRKKGINAEIKQYQEQKAEAERFETLQEEKANLLVSYLVWKLFHIERNITSAEKVIVTKDETLRATYKELDTLEEALKSAKKELATVQRESYRKERSIAKREAALSGLHPEALSLDEKVAHVTKKIKSIKANGTAVKEIYTTQNQRVTRQQAELAQIEKAAAKFEEEARVQEEARDVTLSQEDLSLYSSKKEEVALRTMTQTQQLGQLRRNIKTAREENSRMKESVAELELKKGRLVDQETSLIDHQRKVESHIAQVLQDQSKTQQELSNLNNERLRIEKTELELNEKLTNTLNQLMEAKLDQRESEKEQRFKETLSSLKRIFPGVYGRITDLCKPTQRKYDAAISVILGRHLDAIVVDREKTAIDCIQLLREQRSGHATFLPLDTLVVKPINDRLRSLAKGARLAIDVVQYDEALERAIQYVCGNALVCDTMDVAKHVCYELNQQVKAVALDGTIFHKSGLITGGQSGIGSGARRWEERVVEDLKKRRDAMLAQLNELSKTKKRGMPEETLKSELAGIESKLSFSREDLSATRRKLNGVREEIKLIETELSEKLPKAEQSSRELALHEREISRIEATVHQIEDEIFASLCQKIGVSNIREYEEQKLKRSQQLSEKRSKFETILSKLGNQLLFDTTQLNETKERLSRLETMMTSETTALDDYEGQRDVIQSKQSDIQKEIETLKQELEAAQTASQTRSDQVNALKKQVVRVNKQVDVLMKDISAKESLVEKLDSERSSIFRRCKLEQIDLPMDKGSLNDVSLDDVEGYRQTISSESSMDIDTEGGIPVRSSQGRRSQEWKITVDFSDLDEEHRQELPSSNLTLSSVTAQGSGATGLDLNRLSLSQSQAGSQPGLAGSASQTDQAEMNTMEKMENDYLDRLRNLSDEIERLAPNMKAIERLDGVEARLKQTDKEFNAARKSARVIKEAFAAVKQERFDRFNRAFQHISEKIDEIYKSLTQSTAFPMGGTAYLSLEDTEEPYLDGIRYHAMPPLKRFRDMDQLSGGEKTMAALALLFAIHSFRPSPFFVLDEVDAALDNMNVARIGHYLQEHASNSLQFIVISLKSSLYERGQGLVGIYRDQDVNSSKTLTLALDQFED
ncbi:Structural maintenance of chromosomes protein 1 [Mortierella sp. AD011]|nr:Structural maintenance of chromosomes protein 1 [Mortierella sp. AD011]